MGLFPPKSFLQQQLRSCGMAVATTGAAANLAYMSDSVFFTRKRMVPLQSGLLSFRGGSTPRLSPVSGFRLY